MTKANRYNKFVGSKQKKENTELVAWCAKASKMGSESWLTF